MLLTAAELQLLFSGLDLAKLRPRRWVRWTSPSPPADTVAIPRSSPPGGVAAAVPAATGLAPGGLLNSTPWHRFWAAAPISGPKACLQNRLGGTEGRERVQKGAMIPRKLDKAMWAGLKKLTPR